MPCQMFSQLWKRVATYVQEKIADKGRETAAATVAAGKGVERRIAEVCYHPEKKCQFSQ